MTHQILYFLVAGLLIFAIPYFFAGAFTDPFYLRFTTKKKKSLVIGTSRAAQGVVPEVMNEVWEKSGMHIDLYNYSFTIRSSPFGKPYLKSILKKIEGSSKSEESFFIVAVDPWSVSTLFHSAEEFEEQNFAPNNMRFIDINPNPEYVFKNVDNRLLMILRKFRHDGHPRLMDDGSLKITNSKTPQELEPITNERIAEYLNLSKSNSFSAVRFGWLKNTIDSLSRSGNCILVRIPVHPKMKKLEEDSMPDFDEKISELAREAGVPYLNYLNLSGTLQSTDGNHLDRKSAIFFSTILAEDIGKLRKVYSAPEN